MQVFDDDFADRFAFDILDPTKIIPEEDVPVRRVGRLVLDRVVDNFFAETEQVAFCTQNIVDGIDFTNDPLLQGRNFSYLDTQLKRLGSPNFTDLPINAPKCPFATLQQDGHMATVNPLGRGELRAELVAGARRVAARGRRARLPVVRRGGAADRSDGSAPESFADHYSQARQFYVSQTPVEQKHIADAFTFELSKVERRRHPRAHGGEPPQRRRGPGRAGGRPARASQELPERSEPAAEPQHRPRAVAGAQHRAERPRGASRAASSACSSATAPTRR